MVRPHSLDLPAAKTSKTKASYAKPSMLLHAYVPQSALLTIPVCARLEEPSTTNFDGKYPQHRYYTNPADREL